MLIKAYAKINWALDITGKRPDGYHLLHMVMQRISLYDEINIKKNDGNTAELVVNGNNALAEEKDNIILKAVELLSGGKLRSGLHIDLTKNIPTGAGLGGGSADAAAVLWALNRLWNMNFSADQLAQMALRLGADVPYCMTGLPAEVIGIGEELFPFQCRKTYPLVLLKPAMGLSTARIYAAYDTLGNHIKMNISNTVHALKSGEDKLLKASIANQFEEPAQMLLPEISECKAALLENGALCSMMTGSGSAVFGVFTSDANADKAAEKLKERFPVCLRANTMQQEVLYS